MTPCVVAWRVCAQADKRCWSVVQPLAEEVELARLMEALQAVAATRQADAASEPK